MVVGTDKTGSTAVEPTRGKGPCRGPANAQVDACVHVAGQSMAMDTEMPGAGAPKDARCSHHP